MKYLLIDGMNFMHRARSGFQGGPHPLMFNFYRNLRALVDQFKPDRVFYVLEGHPRARHEAHSEYKANRVLKEDDKDYEAKALVAKAFYGGANDVMELMVAAFPITVVKHPDYECDDVINFLTGTCLFKEEDEVVIASSDSDFIQTLQNYRVEDRLKLYNPMKKEFVEAPTYPYVAWKALRGDGSDNIPGVPGCGDKTATKLVTDEKYPEAMHKYLSDPTREAIWKRNYNLIRFHEFLDGQDEEIQTWTAHPRWDLVKDVFAVYGFNSIINDKSWKKFVDTFQRLVHEEG